MSTVQSASAAVGPGRQRTADIGTDPISLRFLWQIDLNFEENSFSFPNPLSLSSSLLHGTPIGAKKTEIKKNATVVFFFFSFDDGAMDEKDKMREIVIRRLVAAVSS